MLILGWLGDNLRNKSVQSPQRLNSAAGKNERKREGGLTDFDYFFTPPIVYLRDSFSDLLGEDTSVLGFEDPQPCFVVGCV